MSTIFGFIPHKSDMSSHSSVIDNLLNAASINNKRSIKVITKNLTLIGTVIFENECNIIENKQTHECYLIGGELFSAPNTSVVPNKLDDFKGIKFLSSLFCSNYTELASQLDGHYAIVRFNPSSRQLDILTDLMGLYPIFILHTDEWTAFSSEYQLITCIMPASCKLDKQFLAELAVYGFTCDGRTPCEMIRALPAACVTSINSNGNISYRKYYNWDQSIDDGVTFEESVAQINTYLQTSIANIISDGRIQTMPLTGGYDSRLLLTLLPNEIRNKMDWVTNCSPYLTEDQDRDVIIAKEIAKRLGLKHHILHPDKERMDLFKGYLYEKLRPNRSWFNVQGHFSGYLRGKTIDFKEKENNAGLILSEWFSRDMCLWAKDSFNPISKNFCSDINENSNLKYYLLNNIKCFMNQDALQSGKWINPPTIFLYNLRTPFAFASLYKKLLTIPQEYINDGKLFLSLLYLNNPNILEIPFTSKPFSDFVFENSLIKTRKIQIGVDYQTVRKRIWKKMIPKYLTTACRRNLYSLSLLAKVTTNYTLEDSPLSPLLPNIIKSHWRYKHIFPERNIHNLYRLEDWFAAYAPKMRL